MFWLIVLAVILFIFYSSARRGKNSPQLPNEPQSPPPQPSPATRSMASTGNTRPSQPSATLRSSLTWVPADTPITVAGRVIPGGLVYFGAGSAANGYQREPAGIDPTQTVDWTGLAYPLGYWPSYDTISPQCRGAFLSWIETGRCDPTVDIGYVFLFFYGIERRVIVDLRCDPAETEMKTIESEVRRLLGIYGFNHSFNTYASGLLEFISSTSVEALSNAPPTIEPLGHNWALEVPLPIRLHLGRCAATGTAIPAAWALAFLRTHPDSGLRTAASRCAAEFDALFQSRYRKAFGDGLVVKAPKSVVTITYRAASSGFSGRQIDRAFEGIPDVLRATSLINRLRDIGTECSEALGPYSRFRGRSELSTSDDGAALLPAEILSACGGPTIANIREWAKSVVDGSATKQTTTDDLIALWRPQGVIKFTRTDAVSMATMFANFGVGIVPDIRFGDAAAVAGAPAVVFPLPSGASSAPSAHYAAASVIVYLCAVVASADGTVSDDERQTVSAQLNKTLDLDAAERCRLEALLSWLVITRAGLTGIKKKVDALDHTSKSAIGRLLVDIAAADGVITPEEIATMTKLYKLLGLDEGEVYRTIHLIGSEDSAPVPVPLPESKAARWDIPPSGLDKHVSIRLDPAKVRARLAETATVTAVLAGIFADDTTASAELSTSSRASQEIARDTGPLIVGLDLAHSELCRRLSSKPSWTRADAEKEAQGIGLPMLDGAIDRINEAAIDACGEPLIDGDDPLTVNSFALAEVA